MNREATCVGAPPLPRQIRILTVVATLLIVCAVAVPIFPSADLWWHLRSGQYILATNGVPHADPFSFSAAGHRWVAHEWLSEVILYGLYRCAKFFGLSAALSVSVGAAFWLVTWRARPGVLLRAGASVVAAWSSHVLYSVRPGELTLLFLAIYLWLLHRYQDTGRVRSLAPLPLLMLLWVNLHGGYVLGLIVVLFFAAGTLLEGYAGQRDRVEGARRARTLGLAFLGCALVVPLNPNGLRMYSYPLETLFSPVMQSAITEWQPLDITGPAFRVFEAFTLAAFLLLIIDRKRTKATELVLFVPFAVFALQSMRNISLCALVCAYLFSNHLPWQSWRWPKWRQARAPVCYALAVAGVILACGAMFMQVVRAARRLERWEQTRCPSSAVEFLDREGLHGRIFNSYAYGGYLIWRLYPDSKVYVDGRADLYGDEFLSKYLDLYLGLAPLEPELDSRRVDLLVLDRFSYLAMHSPEVNAHWKKAYEDSISAVFVRRETSEGRQSPD